MANTVRINTSDFKTMISRIALAAGLGQSFGGARNLYESLGYKKILTFNDYWMRYDRDGVAKRIVRAYPEACWSGNIQVLEKDGTSGKKSELNKAFADLNEEFGIITQLMEADVLSRIGRFGILLFGIKDGKRLDEPLGTGDLLYIQPYMEKDITITTMDFESSTSNPRYGRPNYYTIQMTPEIGGRKVHYSRVIHMAYDMGSDRNFGTPYLHDVFNYLQNLETVGGGSAEMFWRGAFPGFSAEADGDAEMTPESKAEMGEELDKFVHNLQRFVRVQGAQIKQFQPQAVDPTAHAEIQYDAISGAKGIPKRIVRGSERGELSSAQDESNWTKRIAECIFHYCEPKIMNPAVRILMNAGVLKKQKFRTLWPDLMSLSADVQSQIAERRTRSLYNYARAPGANEILPETFFLRDVMGYSDEQIIEIGTQSGALMEYSRKMLEMKAEFAPKPETGTEPSPVKQEPAQGQEAKL